MDHFVACKWLSLSLVKQFIRAPLHRSPQIKKKEREKNWHFVQHINHIHLKHAKWCDIIIHIWHLYVYIYIYHVMFLRSETNDLVKSELFQTKLPSWTITPWRKKRKKQHLTESKKLQLLAHGPMVDVAGCSWFGSRGMFCVHRLGETCHIWWSCRVLCYPICYMMFRSV